MWTELARSVGLAAPAALAYLVLAPVACGYLDRKFNLSEFAPGWLQLPGAVLFAVGAAIAIWTFVLFAFVGRGTPNPLAPPRNLVRIGPYRYSRNPMMIGGWIAGLGLGLLLRSPTYLLFCGVVVVAGAVYVIAYEEPSLVRRFGTAYTEYRRSTPRWFGLP